MVLGVAAIWDDRKGLEDFIKLRELLNNEYEIILVGLTSEQKKSLPENMIGITRTNNINELRELYAIADVFLNPTYEDNYPTTNIEAIACGTPVITYETGGSPEALDEKSGLIIPKGDINLIGIALQQIRKLDFINFAKKSHQFNKENKVLEYLKLYK